VAKCLLAVNQRVNCDEGIGMEKFCPKPKKAVSGWKAETLETQVSVARLHLPFERGGDRWVDILNVCFASPALCPFRKIAPFLHAVSVGVSPRSGTFVSGVALPIQANFFARLVAQTI
jgi:hypothetical protein